MAEKTNVMPHNLDAEQALLGCMIIDNIVLADVIEQLVSDDFYHESHQLILSAMKLVNNEHKPVDLVTLADKLETEGTLEKCGGLNYLTTLAQITPSAANFKHYLEIVKRDSTNRTLIRAAQDIIKYSQNSDDGFKSVQYAEEHVYNISSKNDSAKMKDIRESDVLDAVIEKFEKLDSDKDAYRGIQTGFTMLDKITNGLQKSDLIVIAARPGVGKTSLAMNIVENAALNNGKVCAIFSLEMPEIQIVQRLMCGYAGVSMANALAGGGKLDSNDWKKLHKAKEKMRKSRIYIGDSPNVTPSEILSQCRRIKSRNNGQLDLVMVDYIQLMTNGKDNGEQNRAQVVADMTRELKIMAKELDVPVLALSQLRRMQTKEPQLSDLRESGAIEQDADIVMFINRPDMNVSDEEIKKNNIVRGMAELIIAKHRNGSPGRIKLRFKGDITKFVNPEPDDNIEEPVYDNAPPPDFAPPAEEFDGDAVFNDEEAPW